MSPADPDAADFRPKDQRDRDFLGAFGVLRRGASILMVQNQRLIGGRSMTVWDLPGGQLEPGELLSETLARELAEELGIEVHGPPRFLFVQEGEKVIAGARHFGWRSFFFAVDAWGGEPRACGEVLAARWWPERELLNVLNAPYHDSFVAWLAGGGTFFRSTWTEDG